MVFRFIGLPIPKAVQYGTELKFRSFWGRRVRKLIFNPLQKAII